MAAHRFTAVRKSYRVLSWPCPLTMLENSLESRAGVQPYQGGFLLHYLDLLVYPNISATLLIIARVVVEDRSALTFSHVTGSRSGIGCPSQ